MKHFPDQRHGESLKDYINRTWRADSSLRTEFEGDFDAYASYCKAMAAGLVKKIVG